MIDIVVTLTRLIVGVPIIAVLGILMLVVLWPLELGFGPICLIFCALFWKRKDIKNSWLGNWPRNIPNELTDTSSKIWEWILDEWSEDED